jgi:hypothetical protein
MALSREHKGWFDRRGTCHQIVARRRNRMLAASAVVLLLTVSRVAAQSPFFTPHTTPASDSLEILRTVADRMWKEVGATMPTGIRIVTPDQLAFQVLYSATRARGMVLDTIPHGERARVSCPFRMSGDTAGLNEKAGPKGFYVGLRIFELTDSTATAGFEVACGAGMAPISAFIQGGKYKLKRWRNHWVIDAIIDDYVT